MTNVTQNPESFITHHSVDDQPVLSFDEAIAIFQRHFTLTNPVIENKRLVYDKFSDMAFADAYYKVARSIIKQYDLPLEARAWEKYKSGIRYKTYLSVYYKP